MTAPPGLGPDREPVELGRQPGGRRPRAARTSSRAASGSSSNPRRRASAPATAAARAASAPRSVSTSPPAASTASASVFGAFSLGGCSRATSTTVTSGGSAASASATGGGLLGRPALDAVGEQVAARGGERQRRERGDQRLGVGSGARPGGGRERLERPGSALAPRRARAAARASRRASPRRVPGDQVRGPISGLSRFPRPSVGRVYSPRRPARPPADGPLDAADQDAERRRARAPRR